MAVILDKMSEGLEIVDEELDGPCLDDHGLAPGIRNAVEQDNDIEVGMWSVLAADD